MTVPRPDRSLVTVPLPARTDAAEPALLALVSAGDRAAMQQLYMRYFARLATFFCYMSVRADVVAELINDTMQEVWKAGEFICPNAPVLPAIMRSAYSRVQQHFAEVRTNGPHSQCDGLEWEPSTSQLTKTAPFDLQVFLSSLSIEERAVAYFVYACGCSRRETADIMAMDCDCVDVLLRGVGASVTWANRKS